MHSTMLAWLAHGAAIVAALLTVRLLPAVLTAAASRRSTWTSRFVIVVAFCALATGASRLGGPMSWFWLLAGGIYLVAVAALVHGLGNLYRAGDVGRFECALVPVMGFVVVPSILLPESTRAALLVLGWDATLSGYSYCVEARRAPRGTRSIGDALFFLLVNPTVVYVRRGRLVSEGIGWHGGGARRMALGAGVLLLANVVLVPFHGTLAALTGASLALQGLTAVAVFAAQYAMHSGLASVQIGFLRQLGYELPERYDHPFLARSPADFWRRWNTYVGAWVQRYLFAPLALHLARYKVASSAAAQATAVVLSFVVVGLMHDGYVYAVDRVVQPRATWVLTVGGVMTLGWLAADRLGILSRASAWSGGRGAGWAVPLAGRAAFVATIILMIVAGRP